MTQLVNTSASTTTRPVSSEAADIDTRQLFGTRSEIRILHQGAIYRLRITKAGKLILNK
jgi:hemin uptake protein HemP